MAVPLKLSAIKNPCIDLELPDGSTKTIDLMETADKLEKLDRAGDGAFGTSFENVRRACGFPTVAEVDATDTDPKPFTLTHIQANTIRAELLSALSELPSSKKLKGLSQS